VKTGKDLDGKREDVEAQWTRQRGFEFLHLLLEEGSCGRFRRERLEQ